MKRLSLKVELYKMVDHDPDTSYLEGKRHQSYLDGEFDYIGVMAIGKITVHYDSIPKGHSEECITVQSMGIWGIESDNTANIKYYISEELDNLKSKCSQFVYLSKSEIKRAFTKKNIMEIVEN